MLTTRELITTLYNALDNKLKKHRGNWEQNDPTAKDYIKNRPFYTDESKRVDIVKETTFDGSSQYGASGPSIYQAEIPIVPGSQLINNNTYTVVFDGVTYNCTPYLFEGFIMVIGDEGMLYGNPSGTEPFLFAIDDATGVIFYTTEGTHTVSIYSEKIKKIDKKYLPDDIVSDLADVAYSGNYYDLNNTPTIYTDVVRYTQSQGLTDTQKKKARDNIGASSETHTHDFSELTINDTEAAKTALAIENGMILKTEKIVPPIDCTCSAYGDGKFVGLLISSDVAIYSTDGINWTETTMPCSDSWRSVTYGNGKFVAVASESGAYSVDGINWIETTMPSPDSWQSVTYGNGKFVAVAGYNVNVAAYSTDGINWTETTLPTTGTWKSVTYGDGKFVAISNANVAIYSTDGINWTKTILPSNLDWNSVTYGDGKFVAVCDDTSHTYYKTIYSTDGINWTTTKMISMDLTWEEIVYGNGMFVAISGTNNNRRHIAYSADGINWNLATDKVNNGGYSTVVYGNGQYIACGTPQKFVYSYDGIVWYDSVSYISQNNTDITADTLATLKHTHDEYQRVKPDWNQSDENAFNYIQNKTHYKYIIEGRPLTYSPDKVYAHFKGIIIDSRDGFGGIGSQCKITYGAYSYNIEIKALDEPVTFDNTDFYAYAGNLYMIGYGNDTGENILYLEEQNGNGLLCVAKCSDNVEITKIEYEVKQLNEEFIPDTIQRTITGTVGQFVVIGDDGNVTTKTVSYAEEVAF